ncbi:MAG: nucleotidyltransferase substrate binding protein [Hydrogenothermaceae bacterium]
MRENEALMKIDNFEKALQRLKEAVETAKDDLDRDGVIQRFEFTVELLWKTLKAILRNKYIECNSPRDCIKQAFKARIIEDDEIILDMLEDRNRSSHIYDESTSREIFNRIKEIYLPYLLKLNLRENI